MTTPPPTPNPTPKADSGAGALKYKPSDSRPGRGLWAPGGYIHTCAICLCGFIGDKRAQWCADCAYAKPDPALAAAEWRPMETAPRDGTWIEIHFPAYQNAECKEARWVDGWWVDGAGCDYGSPDLWRPIVQVQECNNSENVECPTCGVRITAQNAGGYRTYCENCVDAAESEEKARLLIEEVLERFESKPRGIPQAHLAAKLAKELRSAIDTLAPAPAPEGRGETAEYSRIIAAARNELLAWMFNDSDCPSTAADARCIDDILNRHLNAAVAQAQALREAVAEVLRTKQECEETKKAHLLEIRNGDAVSREMAYGKNLDAIDAHKKALRNATAALAASEAGK